MLQQVRQQVISNLWCNHREHNPELAQIEGALKQHNIKQPHLDHLAIIDLPGPNSGRAILNQIFSAIGYTTQGCDYLPEKQNDFIWLTESNSYGQPIESVLPQVVVADFRPEEMPKEISDIILKYSSQSKASPLNEIQNLAGLAYTGNQNAAHKITELLSDYLKGRDWPLPSKQEFETVLEYNELLAWVLIFGRRPNHFSYSVHLLPEFNHLEAFLNFIEKDVQLPLNHKGGRIKGCIEHGIMQGSTQGTQKQFNLNDGSINIPGGFIEFVWRFKNPHRVTHTKWEDYFTGFIAQNANRVIESLYQAS